MAMINQRRLTKKPKKLAAPLHFEKESTLSKILLQLNHVAQIGLFLLAIFGYFYTVRPLYTKALLEEQIAEKEIQLKDMAGTLVNLKKDVEKSKSELSEVRGMAEKAKESLNNTTIKLHETQKLLVKKEIEANINGTQLKRTEIELVKNYQLSRIGAIDGIKTELAMCVITIRFDSSAESDNFAEEFDDCIQNRYSKSPFVRQLNDKDKDKLVKKIDILRASVKNESVPVIAQAKEDNAELDKRLIASEGKDKGNDLIVSRLKIKQEVIHKHYEAIKKISDVFFKELNEINLD